MASDGYIGDLLATDPDDIAQSAFADMQAAFPGWMPDDAKLETQLIRGVASVSANLNDAANQMMRAAFAEQGSLVGDERITATAASANTTWTMKDDAGYQIPNGFQVSIPDVDGTGVAFAVTDGPYNIAPGATTTGAGEVALVALDAGTDANDLSGAVTLLDSFERVASVTLTGPTGGGVDDEDVDAYLDRLAQDLRIASPKPVNAQDAAVLARRVPGVTRAYALNDYDPDTPDTPTLGHVTVAAVDADGNPLSSTVKTAVTTALANPIQNLVFHVIDPTYTAIDVEFSFTILAGYDSADVQSRAEAAVGAYLSPALWATPDQDDTSGWTGDATVRYFEGASIVDRVDGVDHVTSFTMRVHATGSYEEADITLTGAINLTTPGDIAGTVS